MIIPTQRAVFSAALGAPVVLLIAGAAPQVWGLGLVWIIVVVGLLATDSLLAARPSSASIRLTTPVSAPVRDAFDASVRVDFSTITRPRKVEIRLEGSETLQFEPRPAISPGADPSAVFKVNVSRRGEAVISHVWIRWTGPLGFVWVQRLVQVDRAIACVSNINAIGRDALHFFARDAVSGQKVERQRGDGSEFDALRDYMPGMDRRSIDWKHSARHKRLVAKEFQVEKNHSIILAIDTGRLMCEPLNGAPKVDVAIQSALLLAYVCLKMGDRAGLFGFDARPRLSTGTVAGVGAFGTLHRASSKLDYSDQETNFTLGLTQLSGDTTRRSLIVVFTDFVDTTSAELMIDNLARLMKRHLVLLVVFRDEELETIAEREPATARQVTEAVVAGDLLLERSRVLARLARLGAEVLHAPAEQVGAALLNRYLDIKRQDLI